ncbi:hypothetical protein [Paenibacillus sp. GP183]|uniref:hypothetical protein n=1 Tax=Paenibacillus sp. GP183 TaxID=1882751 RepID=UPI001115459B|nr:hypothetical protein [Paenibacillus sp. GP183]
MGVGTGLSPATGLAFVLAPAEIPADAVDLSITLAAAAVTVAVGFALGCAEGLGFVDTLADGVVAATVVWLAVGVFATGLKGVDVGAALSFLPPHAVNMSNMAVVTAQTAMVFFNIVNLSLIGIFRIEQHPLFFELDQTFSVFYLE